MYVRNERNHWVKYQFITVECNKFLMLIFTVTKKEQINQRTLLTVIGSKLVFTYILDRWKITFSSMKNKIPNCFSSSSLYNYGIE